MKKGGATLTTAFLLVGSALGSLPRPGDDALDRRVEAFLRKKAYAWRDMNVPEADGRLLHEIVIKNGCRRGLEIGTSTGHSGIWIAWALAKTGGRLVTIEIDSGRHREAVENFREAGLSPFIDARLGDAHEVVRALDGPFDFVFIDAEKEGYVDYAEAVIPKLSPGGCIVAHNVYAPGAGRRSGGGTGAYAEFMRARPDFETTYPVESRGGLAVSFRKKDSR